LESYKAFGDILSPIPKDSSVEVDVATARRYKKVCNKKNEVTYLISSRRKWSMDVFSFLPQQTPSQLDIDFLPMQRMDPNQIQ
jgi:hypothetical protein